ncbi:MAG: bifunctional 4-hydroxy-3-methylbut-2-enyl diphosphate reductase/30S ribosomal protein S1 [Clostridia bacterium]|nr:bifunctional 4-hydroxy-3-methylbut-2-enyl diphosphate reductase/30S ribosomal protein S1 [Clostridia bacterium]
MADKIVFDNGKTTITLAEHAGFCYGVQRALETAYETIRKYRDNEDTQVRTFGPIIHNDDVIDGLKEMGVFICDAPGEVSPEDVIIIRSHGVGRDIESEIGQRAHRVIDATCPYVKRIHKLVSEAHEQGKQIVIIGDRNHHEVQGINGWCGYSAMILDNVDEAVSAVGKIAGEKTEGAPVFVVAQTTLNRRTWDECTGIILDRIPDAELNCTICSATGNRQNACRELAKKSDMMIIIGSRSSSNTRKLFEIAEEECSKTYFVENKRFLSLKDVKKCNRIGISAGASAPERIIKEVIAYMSEVITNNPEEKESSMQDMMEEIEKSFKVPQRNDIVKGEVIQVGPREVYVNLGYKKDGVIPKDEVSLEEGQDLESLFKVGDEVEAKVLKTDDGDGNVLLSRKKIEISAHWNEIVKAFEDKAVIEVKVVREVKGGVIASYKEVSGFIPMSQLNDRYVEKADEFIGQTLQVKVSRVDQRRNKAVFSHKTFLNEEKSKKIDQIWASLHVGDVVEGTVMRFTDYGAFVDIGGIDGLLHISEISWGKLKHPQEALTIGQKINVKILSMNQEKGKISLGLKQNTPEPWSVIDENYQVGQIIEGKVVQLKEYGAFVEIEPGLDGLVHISEIAARRVNNIADELTVGQTVSTKILDIDYEKRRISLSIKAALPEGEAEEQPEEETAE